MSMPPADRVTAYTMPAGFEARVIRGVSSIVTRNQTISPKWLGNSENHPYAPTFYKDNIVLAHSFLPSNGYRQLDPNKFSLSSWYPDFANHAPNLVRHFKVGEGLYMSNEAAADKVYDLLINSVFGALFSRSLGSVADNAAAKAAHTANLQIATSTGNPSTYLNTTAVVDPPICIVGPPRSPVTDPGSFPEICTGYPLPPKREPPLPPFVPPTRNTVVPVNKAAPKVTPTRNQAKPIAKPVGRQPVIKPILSTKRSIKRY